MIRLSGTQRKKHEDSVRSRDTHSWIDVSRHGSPIEHCEYCDVHKWDVYGAGPNPQDYAKASPVCPKRKKVLARRRKAKAEEERAEYQRLLKAKKRFEYLHKKYG